jgi:hypothetical protein
VIEVRNQAELAKALKKTNNGADELIVCVGGGHFRLPAGSRVRGRENCSIVGWGNCSIEGWGNCSIEGWENCSIVGRENCSIEGRENCSIEGWGNCSIEGWENCSIVGRENCSIVGWGNCSIEGWENCSIVGWENCSIRAWSDRGSIKAAKNVVVMKHNPAATISGGRVLEMHRPETAEGWCEFYGVEIRKGGRFSRKLAGQDVAILFKVLPKDLVAYGGFQYVIGETPAAPDWDGGKRECGGGLHFSPTPRHAEKFGGEGRYIACPVLVSELCVHPDGMYPQKVKAPGCCAPIWEVDVDGNAIAVEASGEAA